MPKYAADVSLQSKRVTAGPKFKYDTLDHPIFKHTRNHVPGIEIEWEESHEGVGNKRQFIAWIQCDDFAGFEAAVDGDPTVSDPDS